jgi:phage shock protein C
MKQKNMPQKISAGWKGTAEMSGTHTKFYLDKQNAKWKGVCAGIADYTGVNILWVRLGAVMLTLMGGFPWTLIAYWITAWMADKKPIHLYTDDRQEQKFWQGVRQSPARTTRDIRSRFREIDNRLADIETYYVSNNKQLADEIESLR